MTDPSTALVADRSPVKLDRVASRERAVGRALKGIVTAGIGWVANLAETPIGEGIFGASQFVQYVWAIAGRSLVWLGLLIAAGAAIQHLRRFGGRRGVLAFASFAAAGACGLVAVAEQFETWFLDTHVLQGLDSWALVMVLVFVVLGGLLLNADRRRGQSPGQPLDFV